METFSSLPKWALIAFPCIMVGLCLICCLYFCTPSKEECCPALFGPPNFQKKQVQIPSRDTYLARTDPKNPPALFFPEYDLPPNDEELPLDTESFWRLRFRAEYYNPGHESLLDLFLVFSRAGALYGIGFDDGRGVATIVGDFVWHRKENQTVLALGMTFRDSTDHVSFRGVGIGTVFSGNCFIVEKESRVARRVLRVPGIKGSFAMLLDKGKPPATLYDHCGGYDAMQAGAQTALGFGATAPSHGRSHRHQRSGSSGGGSTSGSERHHHRHHSGGSASGGSTTSHGRRGHRSHRRSESGTAETKDWASPGAAALPATMELV